MLAANHRVGLPALRGLERVDCAEYDDPHMVAGNRRVTGEEESVSQRDAFCVRITCFCSCKDAQKLS